MIIKNQLIQIMGLALIIWMLVGCGSAPTTPTTMPSLAPAPSAVVVTEAPKPGYITGRVHLVSPPTPPMTVYALDQATGGWAFTETPATDGESPFTMSVPPGTYMLFAFSQSSGYAGYSLDGWTLADVQVSAGQTVADIVVRPPSQSECGSLFGVPASPDNRYPAVAGPTEDCRATVVASGNQTVPSSEPQRIQFAAGATSSQVQGTLNEGGAQYVLSAMTGQQMTVTLNTGGDPALSGIFLNIWGKDGYALVSDEPRQTSWTGTLPSTQDYYIAIKTVAQAPVVYTMDVSISAITPSSQEPAVLPDITPVGYEFLYGLGLTFMLPPEFPVSQGLPAALPYVITSDPTYYDISLDFGPECHGAGACHYGSLSGKKVATNQPESTPNFIFEANRAIKVSLAKNIEGYYLEGLCGASCDDSRVFWIYSGFQYMIGLKGSTQQAVVDLANAAITNSLR